MEDPFERSMESFTLLLKNNLSYNFFFFNSKENKSWGFIWDFPLKICLSTLQLIYCAGSRPNKIWSCDYGTDEMNMILLSIEFPCLGSPQLSPPTTTGWEFQAFEPTTGHRYGHLYSTADCGWNGIQCPWVVGLQPKDDWLGLVSHVTLAFYSI